MTDSELLGLIIGAALVHGFYWALVCAFVADEKGRKGGAWGFAGFFGGVLAFIPLAAAPVRKPV